MKLRAYMFGALLAGAIALSACAPTAMPEKPQSRPASATATVRPVEDQTMAGPTAEAEMAKPAEEKPMANPTAGATMDKPAEGQMAAAATATPDVMMQKEMPAWFAVQLTDVTTGRSFAASDLKGKVVLVETMAIWCPTCLRQQKEVQTLHEALGNRDDLVGLILDIDPNEDAAALRAYAAKHSFGGLYAVAPADVSRAIGRQLGDQFLNPPSAPMFVIDRSGQVHPLPFGVKSAQALADALQPFLAEQM